MNPGQFQKGRSGNPHGRTKGSKAQATLEWEQAVRSLLGDATYRRSLRTRLLNGELPPILEAKLMAYAYGEPAKPDDPHKPGLTVHIGFLGSLQPDGAKNPVIDLVPTPAPGGQVLTPAAPVTCLPTPLVETPPDPGISPSQFVPAAPRSSAP